MSEAAHQINVDLISVDGLDDVFAEIVPGTPGAIPKGTPKTEQGSPEAIPVQSKDIPEGVPVEEAARVLGLPLEQSSKGCKKGSLSGFKVPSKFGDKWLVAPEAIPAIVNGKPEAIPEGIPESAEAIPVQLKDIPQGVPVEIVQELLKKVEALTYRNGYLESQVAERDRQIEGHQEQIKLLTDSQHKQHWWHRFGSWFMIGR